MKTKKNNQENVNAVGKEDRALNIFADMMIEKIESLQGDWQKPWFTESSLAWPRNLSGREYNGMNTLMLLMHCERMGYRLPVFLTFNRCMAMNFTSSAEGRVPAVDAKGELCPDCDLPAAVRVFGGKFRGVCNGDATSLEVFTEPKMRLFHGELVVTVECGAGGKEGELRVTADVVRENRWIPSWGI